MPLIVAEGRYPVSAANEAEAVEVWERNVQSMEGEQQLGTRGPAWRSTGKKQA